MTFEQEWLTVREVADRLRVKEATVREWIKRGDLAALDLGARSAGYRVRPRDLEDFIGRRYRAPHREGENR